MANYTDRMGNPITEQQYKQMQGMNTNDGLYTSATNNGYTAPTYTPSTSGIGSESGGLFDSWSASGFNDIIGGVGGLYQMYQGHKFMGLAEDDMAMRQESYDAARADEDVRMANNKSYGSAFSQNA